MVLTRETLSTCTRIRSGNVGGSGTVIYSEQNKEGTYSTYVLTNEHVVDNNIKTEKEWSTLLKRDVKKDILGIVEVHFFQYKWEQRSIGATAIEADIMTYDKREDLALLKLRSEPRVESVARLYPKGKEKELRLGMSTMAIGAALGEPPVLTVGRLSQFGREIDNREYWLQTAPTIYGNSGGSVFLEETEDFIGVPSRLAVTISGFGSDAITHLSYIVPITRIYGFLDDQLFRFIYDSKFTEEGESEERERRRKEEELKIAAKEIKGGDGEPD